MLDERKRKILQAIIDDYVSTAEPIGSRTIARKYDLGISPATIRNEMADLELLGYLEQPHTSAGRIPAAKGYRFYVDSLMSTPAISENDVMLITNWYQTRARRIEEVFQETAKIISRMTRNVSLVLAPQFGPAVFKYLQFMPLDNSRVILAIVTDTGYVENKVLTIPEGLVFDDLHRIAERINRRLSGQALEHIRSSVFHDIRQDFQHDRVVFDTLLEVIRHSIAGDKQERLYLGGTAQLLAQPEYRDVKKVKDLLSMLEEERLLCDILHTKESDGVVITIGGENKYSGIQDCSVVQATYRIDGQVVGTVAVLGPTRMEYGKITSVLEFMHRHLGDILNRYRL